MSSISWTNKLNNRRNNGWGGQATKPSNPLEALLSSVNLGPAPNIIPPDTPRSNCAPRKVAICFRDLGGMGKMMNNPLASLQHELISRVTQAVEMPPHPLWHWGVAVGDFYHELNADPQFHVLYQNGRLDNRKWKWHFYTVGTTRHNDESIRLAGHEAIKAMPPLYEALTNNCQKMAMNLLGLICEPGCAKVATSWSWGVKLSVLVPSVSAQAEADETSESTESKVVAFSAVSQTTVVQK